MEEIYCVVLQGAYDAVMHTEGYCLGASFQHRVPPKCLIVWPLNDYVANCSVKFQPVFSNKRYQSSQELQMRSSVTLDCKVTKIVIDSNSQLSKL